MDDLLREGKLEQTCPQCGRWEAAGFYCTGCHVKTGEADWYANGDLAERERRGAVRRQDAPEKSPTPVKRGRGRPRRVERPEVTFGL